MTEKEDAKEIVRAALSPHTVGRLIKVLSAVDPETPVFVIEYGNSEGSIKWKRKVSWKQWIKQRKEQ